MDTNTIRERYTAKETAAIVGVTYARLDAWSRRGEFYTASVQEASGRGSKRLYSFVDLIELSAIKRLRDMEVSMQALRKAKDAMSGLDLWTPWTFLVVSEDGDLLVEQGKDQVISLLHRPGQYALRVVNLSEVAREVEKKAAEIIEERAVSVA